MSKEAEVLIFDTTLRDGEQAAGATMTVDQKVEIAHQLDKLGVDIIEAGFPVSSPGELAAVQRIAREVRRPIICALSHASNKGVDAAWDAVKDAERKRIHIFLSTSEIHMYHQLHKDREEILSMACENVARARGYCDDVEFSPMDATRSDPEYLFRLLEATIDSGASTINIPDYRRLHDPRGVLPAHPGHLRERAQHRQGAGLRPLSQRPRHGRGQ